MVTNKFSRTPPPATAEEFLGQAAMTAEAKPAAAVPPAPVSAPVEAPAQSVAVGVLPADMPPAATQVVPKRPQAAAAPVEVDESVYRTLTLRLTKDRYKRIKMLATTSETPIQQLLVEALDDFLRKRKA